MTATSGADRQPCGCEGYREHHHGCTKFAGADRPTLREQLAEEMGCHRDVIELVDQVEGDPFSGRFQYGCTCGAKFGTYTEREAAVRIASGEQRAERLAHIADALLPVVERAKADAAAEALDEAADGVEADWREQCSGNRSMVCESCRRYDEVLTDLRTRAAALRSQGGGR